MSNAHCCSCNVEEVTNARRRASQARLQRRDERAKQVHERKLAHAAAMEGRAKARVEIAKVKEAAKVEKKRIALEHRKVARSLLLQSHEQKTGHRSARRRQQALARGHAPPPHERDCPPKPPDGRCQCCGRKPRPGPGGCNFFCQDHDHITGEFRGWICDSCNRGIGALCDTPGGVRAALEYLERVYRDKPEPWWDDWLFG